MNVKKIINDTLKNPEGKFSRKSLTAFVSFFLAIVYEYLLPFLFQWLLPDWEFETKEYVFITLLTLTGSVLGLTVWDKKSDDG